MKLLTISIPAYNVEKYIKIILEHALEVRNKEYLEVLIINDGSKDHTGEIADFYVQKNPNLFRHIRKDNGGHGSAITTGYNNASGIYFYNIDGDDDIHPDKVDQLLEILLKTTEQYDCILLNYERMEDTTGELTEVKNKIGKEPGNVYSFSDIFNSATLRMHTMILRTNILKQSGLSIDEHRFYVDKEYIFYSLPNIMKYIYFDFCIYKYRIGLANQSMSINGARKHNQDREFVSKQLARFYENNKTKFSAEMQDYLKKNISYSYIGTINGYIVFKWNDFSVRKRLFNYDKDMQEISNDIYDQVFKEKSTRIRKIRLLKFLHFYGWRIISLLGRTRREVLQ